MLTETVHVPAIACERAIERELHALAGVKHVTVDVEAQRVTLTYQAPATLEAIQALMSEIGYPVADSLEV